MGVGDLSILVLGALRARLLAWQKKRTFPSAPSGAALQGGPACFKRSA
jgi:hypothetical protein